MWSAVENIGKSWDKINWKKSQKKCWRQAEKKSGKKPKGAKKSRKK